MQAASMQANRNSDVQAQLPPGQRAMADFPRFGVAEFARRPLKSNVVRLEISGALERSIVLTAAELGTLPRVTITADFHCAAGWSHRAATWSGFRFKDAWDKLILPNARPTGEIGLVVLRGQDGYRTALPLSDLLAPEVLIADRLNDEPLTIEHGAPIRLVAPAHYGYKSAKHLDRIELRTDDAGYRPLLPRLLDHPRARVALEERGQILPGWLLRYLFRPLIKPLIRKIKLAGSRVPKA
jgi:DMSO/TMAO reductase YedYZ molybdopterin-dependent catalytic subunit